jgi:hypothetical protein
MKRVIAAIFLCLSFSKEVMAGSIYLGAGYDVGGEMLVELCEFAGDCDGLYGGEGAHIVIGYESDIKERYMFRGMIGYKFDSIDTNQGDAKYSKKT